jgi:asparagine synthase (glutamine-hydrolysing)
MSTPFAVFARDARPVTAAEVEDVLAALAQQGPDGRGLWSNGVVGLGHLALFETPEMRFEEQPAPLDARLDATASREIVISADVRLDNRAELAGKLQIDLALLPTLGDSQLLLAAYLRWGEECPRYLLGDFAFVIWDGPQRKLFCARDPLGVKPLYTYICADLFIAAGDVRAIAAHSQGPRRPNLESLAYHLVEMSYIHPTKTYMAGVEALAPAHSLTITATATLLRRYWFPEQLPAHPFKSLESAAEELAALVEDAVRVRLRRVAGVGAHMSGGLDSTSIAFVAARQLRATGDSISTYSWQPAPSDDAQLAIPEYSQLHKAIAAGNFDHTTVRVTPADFVREIEQDLCLHHGQNFVYERLVRQAAATRQVRVLLSGWGGDELITAHGNGYLAEMFWRGQWGDIGRYVQGSRVPAGKNALRHRLGLLYHHILLASLPNALCSLLSPRSEDEHNKLPAYVVCASSELAQQLATLPPRPRLRRRTRLRDYQLQLLHYGHLHRRIESWAAEGADDHFVYRYPLLDRRVVEFALGLPAGAYVQGNWGRYLYRCAMNPILPQEICWGTAKLEPTRVQAWIDLSKAALLPALDATVAHLGADHHSIRPRLEIDALRRHITRAANEPGYELGDVGIARRAIQVLGAGWQLAEQAAPRRPVLAS